MKQLPNIESYGRYSSDNYGLHTLKIVLPKISFYFSYDTIVAFYTIQTGRVVCKNNWSTTTGKHLNWIDGGDKKSRLSYDEFQTKLESVMKELGMDND